MSQIRGIGREEEERGKQDRFRSSLVIAASIISAVRLARDRISRSSPGVQIGGALAAFTWPGRS